MYSFESRIRYSEVDQNQELSVTGIINYLQDCWHIGSGYSDMAIGLGRMLGFEFMRNFNSPYISRSITAHGGCLPGRL